MSSVFKGLFLWLPESRVLEETTLKREEGRRIPEGSAWRVWSGLGQLPVNSWFLFLLQASLYRPLLRLSSLTTSLLAPLGPFMASSGIRHQHVGLSGFYWIFSYFLLNCGLQEARARLYVQLFVLST